MGSHEAFLDYWHLRRQSDVDWILPKTPLTENRCSLRINARRGTGDETSMMACTMDTAVSHSTFLSAFSRAGGGSVEK